jgi:iron-sulfur cluster insertion protein
LKILTITSQAAKKIKSIINEEDSSLKLRIFVQGGGCSGFQYGFTLEPEPPSDDDLTFMKDDVEVVVDSMSMQYMNEAVIDYEETLMGSEFKIKNPNVTATCGCGSSFTV